MHLAGATASAVGPLELTIQQNERKMKNLDPAVLPPADGTYTHGTLIDNANRVVFVSVAGAMGRCRRPRAVGLRVAMPNEVAELARGAH